MNIIGKSECTASQMAQYLINKNPDAKPWALEYAKLYLEEGEAEGVRGDGAWIQSCKETGNFMFIGGTAVTFDQNNFCGLGVTRKGLKGHSFDTPRLGIRAQIQHLKGYATTAPLVNTCIDPRYKYVTKGCAPRFEDLAGKWAVPGYNTKLASSLQDAMNKGIGYGFDIIAGIEQMKKITVSNTTTTPTTPVNTKYRVAVDAGHGSETAGKRTPDGYKEHWINVKCANYFDIAMKRCGIETVKISWDDTNAKDDIDVSLVERQKQIKNAKCDISVSWHANAHGNGQVYTTGQGIETLIHNDSSKVKDSRSLADKVQFHLIQGTQQRNRGVKTQSLAMCNCSAMGTRASILIEIGFMTNEYESALLKTDAFCLECAEEAARGVCEYLGVPYKTSGNVTIVTPSSVKIMKPTVKVNSSLNVRNKPNGTIVGKLYNGNEVDILDYNNGWFKIDTDKWVSATYINNSHGRVTASVLNIRTGAGTKYADIGDLKKNEIIRILEEQKGWYKVLSESQKLFGWVSAKYVELI